jgi:hypothetical protein
MRTHEHVCRTNMGGTSGGSGTLQFVLSRGPQSFLVVGCIFAFAAISFLPCRQYRGTLTTGIHLDTEYRGMHSGRDHGLRRGLANYTGKSYTDQTVLQYEGAGEPTARIVCEEGSVLQRKDFFPGRFSTRAQSIRYLRRHGIPDQYSGKPQYNLYRGDGSGGRVARPGDFLSNATLPARNQKGFSPRNPDDNRGQRASSTTRNTKGLVLYHSWVRLGLCLQMVSYSRIPRDQTSCFRVPIA